ncbi:MAG: RlmF-related methyltransferase [Candidatus Hodarchaeales archaeon]
MNQYTFPTKRCGLPIEEALIRFPELKKFTDGMSKKIDLGNTNALLLYNRLILLDFLDLDFSIPEGFLVPTICSRWEFLKWCLSHLNPISRQRILEIGTGASAILALILAKIGILVDATEINEKAYLSAKENIKINQLSQKINLKKAGNCIIRGLYTSLSSFNAVISNPPQYDLDYFTKRISLKKGFLGQESELVGGQKGYEFIIQTIKEVKEFEDPPPLFFQITSLKLAPLICSFLSENNHTFIQENTRIGTRKRVYFKIY